MPILYFWVRENYLSDTEDGPSSVALEQNAKWLGRPRDHGESLWAFTRNSRGDYVLVLHYKIGEIQNVGARGMYGTYQIIPKNGTTRWFDPEESESVERVIRSLSFKPKASPLGRNFQGHGAIRKITAADAAKLSRFADALVTTNAPPTPRPTPAHGAARVEWGDTDGWVDYLPLHFFNETDARVVTHLVRKGSEDFTVACVLTMHGPELQMDYAHELVRDLNRVYEIDEGVLRIRFEDKARTTNPSVEWFDALRKTWTSYRGVFRWPEIEDPGEYSFPKDSRAERGRRTTKLRPTRDRFRNTLTEVYGDVCLLSGCAVEEAIDAVHIDAYDGPQFDHPQNGLLLRKDLHCLFDTGLLAFEPKTGRASFAAGPARAYYADLHGRMILKPHPLYQHHAPSEKALATRWKEFCRFHGERRHGLRSR
jgi:hypothetical protein